MSYLNPLELFKFAFLSSKIESYLTIEMVIRSAMLAGGNAKKSIEELLPLILDGSVFPPSASRLLRLINGTVCELCKVNKVNHVRSGFGLFYCWDCVTKHRMTQMFKKSGSRYLTQKQAWDAVFDHTRVAKKSYSWRSVTGEAQVELEIQRARAHNIRRRWRPVEDDVFNVFQVNDLKQCVWSFPTADAFGERTGPIVTMPSMHDIVRQMRNDDFGNEETLMATVDEYIDKVLKGPSMNALAYEEFKTAYYK